MFFKLLFYKIRAFYSAFLENPFLIIFYNKLKTNIKVNFINDRLQF